MGFRHARGIDKKLEVSVEQVQEETTVELEVPVEEIIAEKVVAPAPKKKTTKRRKKTIAKKKPIVIEHPTEDTTTIDLEINLPK